MRIKIKYLMKMNKVIKKKHNHKITKIIISKKIQIKIKRLIKIQILIKIMMKKIINKIIW